MFTFSGRVGAITMFILFTAQGIVTAGDWPNWRGPNHNGASTERNFKTLFKSEPKKLWERPIGSAYSGISVVGDRLYTCGIDGDAQTLFCLKNDDGSIVWKARIEDQYKNEWGDGARGTPTIHDGHVYIMGARGTVACFKAADGEKVWSREYGHKPQWGYSGSILIHGDLAIVATGGKDGALRALDKSSGREVWHCGNDADSGYSTPYPFTFDGVDYVCAFLGNGAIVADVRTGREVLHIPWKTDWKVNAATPIYHDGHLWLGSGYRTGCGVYKLSKEGDKLAAKEVWQSKVMLNKFQTPVLYEGKLYAFDERALKCVDFMTGERHWQERGANGTVLLASEYLVTLTEDGRLQVGLATAEGFKATGKAQVLDDRCWTVPTLVDGRLYVRNLVRIVCYDLSK